MTIHYHGTPITPMTALYELAGRCFCVSFERPDQVAQCHEIGQSVMLDNGAFSAWRRGAETDWPAYYQWCERWLAYCTTWAVVPDVIDAGPEAQDALLLQWPHGKRQAAPVWHMDEPISRLLRLCEQAWQCVCVGSTALYRVVLSPAWCRRMDDVFNASVQTFGRVPPLHMLRGMACCGKNYPFARVDSTDIARNHNRPQNTPRKMADRWDAMQCPATWRSPAKQLELIQ